MGLWFTRLTEWSSTHNNSQWTIDLDGDGNDDFDFFGCAARLRRVTPYLSPCISYVSFGPVAHPGADWARYDLGAI